MNLSEQMDEDLLLYSKINILQTDGRDFIQIKTNQIKLKLNQIKRNIHKQI